MGISRGDFNKISPWQYRLSKDLNSDEVSEILQNQEDAEKYHKLMKQIEGMNLLSDNQIIEIGKHSEKNNRIVEHLKNHWVFSSYCQEPKTKGCVLCFLKEELQKILKAGENEKT